jgi:hypothetical protein
MILLNLRVIIESSIKDLPISLEQYFGPDMTPGLRSLPLALV